MLILGIAAIRRRTDRTCLAAFALLGGMACKSEERGGRGPITDSAGRLTGNNRGELAPNAPIESIELADEEAKNMLRKMVTEVMFLNPNDLIRGSAELIEHDFEVEYLDDWIDDYGPAVWVKAWTLSELDASGFLRWVQTIVAPVGGDVSEAGPA
jgi:hypothetical protein